MIWFVFYKNDLNKWTIASTSDYINSCNDYNIIPFTIQYYVGIENILFRSNILNYKYSISVIM